MTLYGALHVHRPYGVWTFNAPKKVEPSKNKGVTGKHQPQASPNAEPQLPSEHR